MTTELVKLDPKEYGLEQSKAKEIEKQFQPAITEREALNEVYKQLLTKELTPELCTEAKTVRLKLVKVRTSIAKIHKAEKAFYLAGGKFVDAWKNKNTVPIEEMESRLMEIEKHYENLEKERLEAIRVERIKELESYGGIIPDRIGEMEEVVYNGYLRDVKEAHQAKLEAEQKAEEERLRVEKVNKLHSERKDSILDLWAYVPEDQKAINFGEIGADQWGVFVDALKAEQEKYKLEQLRRFKTSKLSQFIDNYDSIIFADMSEDEYIDIANKAIEARKAEEEKQAAIEKENERLQKEAEEKQARDKKRDQELKPYIIFIRDYNKMLNLNDDDYNKELANIIKGAEQHWEYERQKEKKAAQEQEKIRKANEAKIKAAQKAAKEAQDKLDAQKEKERIEAERKAQEQERANKAPDKEKLTAAITNLLLPELELSSKESESVYEDIATKFEEFKTQLINQIKSL